jgi:hypothetical protein
MSLFNIRKNFISNNIVVNFTSTGIANLCNYAICDRYDDNYGKLPPSIELDKLSQLNHGDKLFLNGFNLQTYPYILNTVINVLSQKNIKLYFYIGVIEPTLQNNILSYLLPYSIKIYCTNNTNPNCKILPIGLRDGEEIHPNHKNFSGNDILNEMKIERIKKYLCLLCFTKETHSTRFECENKLGNKSYIYNLNANNDMKWENKGGIIKINNKQSIHCGMIPQWIFYQFCHESYYTLCPRGAGEDTHRFFESLALNSIPIVKRSNTPFDETFSFFPCLIIDDWSECTEEFLLKNLDNKLDELLKFHTRYPNFLTNVETIKKILDNI